MYGQGATLGATNVVTGVSLLPETGDNQVLFAVAASLLVSGAVILVVSVLLARKTRRASAAN